MRVLGSFCGFSHLREQSNLTSSVAFRDIFPQGEDKRTEVALEREREEFKRTNKGKRQGVKSINNETEN